MLNQLFANLVFSLTFVILGVKGKWISAGTNERLDTYYNSDIRFTPGLPHQPIEFEDPNESHSETQSIKFQDQPNQFEGFDLIEPQTQQEQQEELQQQQEQLANGCFIQQCDQTITGRQLLYSRALEIIQDEEYLDESDFDEIKIQKRQINPWTPTLINNGTSLIKDGHSLQKPKLTFYNHSTVTKNYIESAHHVSIWNETDGKRRLFGKRLRSKRQTEAVTNGECPSGWLNAGELGGCYLFSPDGPGINWEQARAFCESVGGFLADILNQESQDFIDESGFFQSYPLLNWWIGANDIANEGQFVWLSGDSVVFEDFGFPNPDNFGIGEDCTHIRKLEFILKGRWNDAPCTFTAINGDVLRPLCKQEQTDPFAETIAEVLEAIIEAAPAAVATGGTVAAATLISMPPLPMTLASGVPPGNAAPGTPGGGAPPSVVGASAATPQTLATALTLVPPGLTPIAVFPPYNTQRTIPAVSVIFSEDPNIRTFKRRKLRKRSLARKVRRYFQSTQRYLENVALRVRFTIDDIMYHLKRELTLQTIKDKVKEKASKVYDNMACLQTRIGKYAEMRKWQSTYSSYPYGIVKRAVNSMDDCFDTIDEPLYGFRTKVTSEKTCGVFGTSCDITKAIKESILQERQTGEEFRSLAPKDCRIINQCV